MTDHQIDQLTHRAHPKIKKGFFDPPGKEVVTVRIDPTITGGLNGHQIQINLNFLERLRAELPVDLESAVTCLIARGYNRYLRVPDDFLQALNLYAAIREVVLDKRIATRYFETYLALWNETDLFYHRGYRDELIHLYRVSIESIQEEKKTISAEYQVLVEILQEKWNVDLGVKLEPFWEHVVVELAEIDYLDSDRREEDIRRFGALMSRYFKLRSQKKAQDGEEEDDEENPTRWPIEGNSVQAWSDSFHDVFSGIAAFLQSQSDEEFARLILEELSAAMARSGRDNPTETSRWWWYRQLAEPYKIKIIQHISAQTSRSFFVSLTEWGPTDGMQNVAPLPSFGFVGTPKFTKQWLLSGPESQLYDRQVPNLLVIIDSSGSMTDANAHKSYAVLGGVVAAKSYLDQGSQVGVYNFSTNDLTLPFTTNATEVNKHIAAFQSGGTTLNTETIEDLIQDSRDDVDLLLITDMGLNGFEETLQGVAKLAATRRVFVILVNANAAQSEQAQATLPDNVQFCRIEKDEDIPGIVLGTIEQSLNGHS